MDQAEYKKIRKEKNFIFLYYKKEGGVVEEASFLGLLYMWFAQMGIQPQHGIAQITHFLDEKFGGVKSNA